MRLFLVTYQHYRLAALALIEMNDLHRGLILKFNTLFVTKFIYSIKHIETF